MCSGLERLQAVAAALFSYAQLYCALAPSPATRNIEESVRRTRVSAQQYLVVVAAAAVVVWLNMGDI